MKGERLPSLGFNGGDSLSHLYFIDIDRRNFCAFAGEEQAADLPMPDPAPVINATLLASFILLSSYGPKSKGQHSESRESELISHPFSFPFQCGTKSDCAIRCKSWRRCYVRQQVRILGGNRCLQSAKNFICCMSSMIWTRSTAGMTTSLPCADLSGIR